MKLNKTILAVVIALASVSGTTNAATGLLTQDPNAPASNYDVVQDKASQAAAGLANSALTQNQQIVTQVNTVSAGVGANAQAIGVIKQQQQKQLQANASLQQQSTKNSQAIAQTNQNLQSLTTNVGQNAQAIGATNANVVKNNQTIQQITVQVGQNAQAIGKTNGLVGANIQQIQQNTADIKALQSLPKPKDGKDGKPGAQGQKGDKGDKGDVGATGAAGKDGKDGKDGVTKTVTVNHTFIKHETDIQTKLAVAKNEKDVKQLKSEVKQLKRQVRNIGASAQATGNLHYNANKSGYAVALGEYDSSVAIAGGVQVQTSEHTAVTLQASYDGDAVGASVGLHGDF